MKQRRGVARTFVQVGLTILISAFSRIFIQNLDFFIQSIPEIFLSFEMFSILALKIARSAKIFQFCTEKMENLAENGNYL